MLATISLPKKVFFFQKLLLVFVERLTCNIIVSGKEETTRSAGRVDNGLFGLRAHTGHHCANQGAGRKILACTAFGVFGVLFKQALINLALHIGAHQRPIFAVDHLDDAQQFGRVLNLVLALGVDLPKHPFFRAKAAKHLHIVGFQLRATLACERFPVAHFAVGHFFAFGILQVRKFQAFVVGRTVHLVGHFQEEQIGDLLQIVAVAHAIVAKDVGHIPDFRYDG